MPMLLCLVELLMHMHMIGLYQTPVPLLSCMTDHTLVLPLSHTYTLNHSTYTDTHTHTLYLSLTHALTHHDSLSLTLSYTLCTHALAHIHSLTRHAHALSPSLPLCHSQADEFVTACCLRAHDPQRRLVEHRVNVSLAALIAPMVCSLSC